MLSKTVCMRCVNAYANQEGHKQNRWGKLDDVDWRKGCICCPRLDEQRWRSYGSKAEAYDSCPYALEHLMSETKQ